MLYEQITVNFYPYIFAKNFNVNTFRMQRVSKFYFHSIFFIHLFLFCCKMLCVRTYLIFFFCSFLLVAFFNLKVCKQLLRQKPILDMSKVTKRKHVMKEMQTDDFDPPESNQRICRILGSRGNNLHEVESAEPFTGTTDTMTTTTTITGTTNAAAAVTSTVPETDNASDGCCQFLVSMPTKFRKNVWVKRGDFVIVEPIDEGDKVKAEIVRILTAQHIKEFKKMDIWPEKFLAKDSHTPDQCPKADDNSDNDNDLFVNTNRAHYKVESHGDSQESSDCESSENSNTDCSDADSGETD